MTRRASKKLGLLMTGTLLAGALLLAPTQSVAAAPAPCRSMETITLKTLHVDVKMDKKTYEVGDTVKLTLTVTRPDDEDPAGQGVPIERPTSQPAEGINAGVGVTVGNVFLYGFGPQTDAKGQTKVNVLLRPYTPAGKPVTVAAFAWIQQLEAPCFTVEEQGSLRIDNAFKVTK